MAKELQLKHIRLLTEDPVDTSRVLKEGQALYEESSGKLFAGDGTRTIAQLDTACEFFSKQGYKEYVAHLAHNIGTGVITVTVIKNELGTELSGPVVWTDDDGGLFTGTLAETFPAGRTKVEVTGALNTEASTPIITAGYRVDDDNVSFLTSAPGTEGTVQFGFTGLFVTIKVWPA